MEDIGQLDDIDYIRSLLEVDKELAIKTIPGLRMPMCGYFYSTEDEDIVVKNVTCTREKLIEVLLENKINVVGLM